MVKVKETKGKVQSLEEVDREAPIPFSRCWVRTEVLMCSLRLASISAPFTITKYVQL